MTKIPTAAIIAIGDEVLSGRTPDKNINWLALRLEERGIKLAEARIIGDVRETIIATARELSAAYDIVFTCGGIGPTHDDITTEAIASAFGRKVVLDPESDRRLAKHHEGLKVEYNDARRRMAHIPEGATLIDNPVSAAPGFIVENVHVLAGVPQIFRVMIEGLKLPVGVKTHRVTVQCNIGEGALAEGLEEIQNGHDGVGIGCYPWFRRDENDKISFGSALVLSGIDAAAVDKAVDATIRMVEDLGAEAVRESK